MLYGYGALRRRPPRLFVRSLLQLMRTRWKYLGPRGATNALVAFARLRMPPHPGWVKGLLRQNITLTCTSSHPTFNPSAESQQGISHSPLAAAPAIPPAGGLTFEGASRCLWALGTLRIDPGPEVIQVLMAEVERAAPSIEELRGKVEIKAPSMREIPDDLSSAWTGTGEGGREDHDDAMQAGGPGWEGAEEEDEDDFEGEEGTDAMLEYIQWRVRLLDQARWGIKELGYQEETFTAPDDMEQEV